MRLFLKKNICTLLIISIIIPTTFFIQPSKVRAVYPVTDAMNLVRNIYTGTQTALTRAYAYLSLNKETVLDPIAYAAARVLIRSLTQSIVNWINSGFEGSPSFIQDPGKFLTNTADQAIGEFIFGSDLAFLCDPFGDGSFKLNIQLALGLSYSTAGHKINCTLSDILKNSKDAYRKFTNGDFVAGGGWDSWISISANPQNNELGAMVIANAEMEAKIDSNKAEANMEAGWGTGTLSFKQCEEETLNAKGEVTSSVNFKGNAATHVSSVTEAGYSSRVSCSTVTPGSLINQQMEDATGSDLKQLQLADEFNEIVGALANYTITSVINNGLLGTNTSSNTDAYNGDIAEMQSEQENSLTDLYGNSADGMDTSDLDSFDSLSERNNNVTNGERPSFNAVENQIRIEENYQRTVSRVLESLYTADAPSAYKSFADIATTTCNPLAQKVLDIILGTITYNETDPDRLAIGENLNVPALEALITLSNENLTTLKALRETIIASPIVEELDLIGIATAVISSSNMHTEANTDAFKPRGVSYVRIVDWLIRMKNIYGTPTRTREPACTIDLSDWGIR